MYSIVIFKETDEVDIVPSSWCGYIEGEFVVKWPSGLPIHKLSAMIKKGANLEGHNWIQYNCRLKGTAKSHEEAVTIRSRAEVITETEGYSSPEASRCRASPKIQREKVCPSTPPPPKKKKLTNTTRGSLCTSEILNQTRK